MQFKGKLLLPDEPGPGLSVNLDVAAHHLAVESDDGGLGAWPLEVVDVQRLDGDVFALTVAGEPLRFVADDTIGFAYSGVPTIERVPPRTRSRSAIRSIFDRIWNGPHESSSSVGVKEASPQAANRHERAEDDLPAAGQDMVPEVDDLVASAESDLVQPAVDDMVAAVEEDLAIPQAGEHVPPTEEDLVPVVEEALVQPAVDDRVASAEEALVQPAVDDMVAAVEEDLAIPQAGEHVPPTEEDLVPPVLQEDQPSPDEPMATSQPVANLGIPLIDVPQAAEAGAEAFHPGMFDQSPSDEDLAAAAGCPAIRGDGRRCESPILTSSGYCYPHDPQRAFEDRYQAALEARKQLKRDSTGRLNRIYSRLDKAMRQVERGELDPETAMAMAQLARTMCAILDIDDQPPGDD